MSVKNTSSSNLLKLRGVGKHIAKQLARLDIYSIQDLLFHLPVRYQNRTQIQFIRQLLPGEEAVIEGVIQNISQPSGGRTKLFCELHDETGKIYLRFFHILSFQSSILKKGCRLRCYSEVRLGAKGLEMIHPEFQVILPDKAIPVDQHLTPIYPATEGLSQHMLRKLTSHALQWLEQTDFFTELIPISILQTQSLPTLKEAIKCVHRPPNEIAITELMENKTIAQRRLVFEELLAHRISLLNAKKIFQLQPGIELTKNEKLATNFLKQLPFRLTQAQVRVIKEINQDLAKPHPMLRLVQGDVGSGKTVIAALAMLQAVENGYQAALMAPTELLAEQHYRVFKEWLTPLGISIVFLSGNVKGSARAAIIEEMTNGQAQIILGTHVLFQDDIAFFNLALVIVDEQHRFGVHQRALFHQKGLRSNFYPHQLIMTATPIPRTLAMSFYADLDCSTIDELPPGRTPITTSIISNARREEVITAIRDACQKGRQAYWVCPLIEESEVMNCQAVTKISEQLQQALPRLNIGLMHGRIDSKSKDSIMRSFKQGDIHLLVATTVIEVGVDVPNASLMIIENAERLGLSQLHQLRGRVGRGAIASHCVLLYQHPLSELAKNRLAVMRETTDGFQIAQKDLELRGPGEVFGTKQKGELSFRIADLIRDKNILFEVSNAAELISEAHIDLIEPLMDRWLGKKVEWISG